MTSLANSHKFGEQPQVPDESGLELIRPQPDPALLRELGLVLLDGIKDLDVFVASSHTAARRGHGNSVDAVQDGANRRHNAMQAGSARGKRALHLSHVLLREMRVLSDGNGMEEHAEVADEVTDEAFLDLDFVGPGKADVLAGSARDRVQLVALLGVIHAAGHERVGRGAARWGATGAALMTAKSKVNQICESRRALLLYTYGRASGRGVCPRYAAPARTSALVGRGHRSPPKHPPPT